MVRNLRVYELGRHYGVDSKQIMALLQKMKVQVKSHMSVVDDDVVDKVHAVFQRKRELARENYAKSHGLNPNQLKNVAALKPLERPQPVEEEPKPAPKKKVAKKKKAPAKPKVVVITKAGTMTKVAKEAARKKEAADEAKAAESAKRRQEQELKDAELAAKREEHAKAGATRAKLVKKADIEKKEPVPEPVIEAASPPAAKPEIVADLDVTNLWPDQPEPEVEEPVAAEPAAEAPPAAEPEAGPTDRLDDLGTKKNDGFKVGDIIRPAPKRREPQTEVSSESVRDSIKAAIRKRQDEAAARDSGEGRQTRTRTKKKKKVDSAEVERALKQTMAELTTGARGKKRRKGERSEDEAVVEVGVLKLTEFITVQELADKLGTRVQELIGHLFGMGIMATINQRLEKGNIELLAAEYDREIEFLSEYGEEVLENVEVKAEDMTDRPPVVTVMGHVDHGKTSLLDNIRKTNVIAGEAGGITQHIGAYTVQTDGGPITFLDTPGHAAFTAMRARGAQVTDIVILIVAADDGVMPQTVEAINHAKAAGVPLIVAINKIDLPDARPERVKQELLQHQHRGRGVRRHTCSAARSRPRRALGIERLLELIHLQAEVLELKASAEGQARGIGDRGQEGARPRRRVHRAGGPGHPEGGRQLPGRHDRRRVRALLDERGNTLKEVRPGEPCEIVGGNDVPEAGDRFYVLESEREARDLAAKRRSLQRQQQLRRRPSRPSTWTTWPR